MAIDNTIPIDGSARNPGKPRSAKMDVPPQPDPQPMSDYEALTTIPADGTDDRPPISAKPPPRTSKASAKVEADEDSDDDSVDIDPDEVTPTNAQDDTDDADDEAPAGKAQDDDDDEDDLSIFDGPQFMAQQPAQAQQPEQLPEVDEKALEQARETLGADIVDKVIKPLQQRLSAAEKRAAAVEQAAQQQKYLAQATRVMDKLGVKASRQQAVLARAEYVFANAASAGRPVTPEQALRYAAGVLGTKVDKRQVTGKVASRQMSPVPAAPRASLPAKRTFQAGITAVASKLKALGVE
ncbi:MAG: hypothetical protein LW650_15385 [Planctomycetaceae bacterium]|jgi:hypothetical protein|nr:hypothetical protein [Planctomycetaceae bacterium]